MKKGSRSIRCDVCGKVIGWVIPTGEYDYGIKRVRYEMKDDCVEMWKGNCVYYRCRECAKNNPCEKRR